MSSPEELAREKIDALLQQCGWILQNRSTINRSASRGVAIREALLKDRRLPERSRRDRLLARAAAGIAGFIGDSVRTIAG